MAEKRKYSDPKLRSTITLGEDVREQGQERAKSLGYGSFSEYVEHLIRADVTARKGHSVTRSEEGLVYSTDDEIPKPHASESPIDVSKS